MKEDDQYSSYITISLLQVSDVTEDYKLLVIEKPTLSSNDDEQSLRLDSVDNLSDPIPELRYPGVDPGSVPDNEIFSYVDILLLRLPPVTTADAPADDPGQAPPAVLALHHQRPPAVSLTAVLTSGLPARTHEDVRDPLVLARVPGTERININIIRYTAGCYL